MKTNLFLKRVLWLMIPLLTIFTTNVWGATSSITLTSTNLELTNSYTTNTTKTVGGVNFTFSNLRNKRIDAFVAP